MIQVFFNERGSGKTKNLISLANESIDICKGHIVYIDTDIKHMFQLDKDIRLITMKDFPIKGYDQLFGFLSGLIAQDYDTESIYIDGIYNILECTNTDELAHYFFKLEDISKRFKVNFFINLHSISEEMPEFIRKYVA